MTTKEYITYNTDSYLLRTLSLATLQALYRELTGITTDVNNKWYLLRAIQNYYKEEI